MGDDERSAVGDQLVEALLNQLLGFGVDVARGLVEDDDCRIIEEGPSDGEALALAAREFHASLADSGLVTLGQVNDELVGLSCLRRFDDALVNARSAECRKVAIANVLLDGT